MPGAAVRRLKRALASPRAAHTTSVAGAGRGHLDSIRVGKPTVRSPTTSAASRRPRVALARSYSPPTLPRSPQPGGPGRLPSAHKTLNNEESKKAGGEGETFQEMEVYVRHATFRPPDAVALWHRHARLNLRHTRGGDGPLQRRQFSTPRLRRACPPFGLTGRQKSSSKSTDL